MKKSFQYFTLGVAVIALVVALMAINRPAGSGGAPEQTAFNRVILSGTLRAGYIVYPPYISRDPDTGELSGVFYDLTMAIAKQLDLEVEWIEEPGYGTIFTSLDDGRYDVYAGGIWANSTRAKVGYLTSPAFYNALYAYARPDDHRFDNNLAAINSPDIRISAIDGTLEDVVAKTDFPNAEEVTLPQTSPFAQEPLQVVTGKADVVFLQPDVISLFLRENPGTLRQVPSRPLRLYGNGFAVKRGEIDLYQMLEIATLEAVNSGVVDPILEKYQSSPDAYLRLAPPFAE